MSARPRRALSQKKPSGSGAHVAAGLLIGFALDRVFGDPQRFHPVAGFGTAAAALERRLHADSRVRGLVHAAVLVGGAVALGVAMESATVRQPIARTAATALSTWAVVGGRSLEREALAVHTQLARSDLPAARQRLTHLVGRDTSALVESEIARAVVESVAENTSDAVVAPLVWGAVAGVPGLLGYRAANTLDAMVGHRNERYERFGWASARLDDVLNLPGARLAGTLAIVLGAQPRAAARACRRDARHHPSPNAGVVESTFAGALGLTLGGSNRYGDRTEHRALMGEGRAPRPEDIPRATRLARRVGLGAVVLLSAGRAAGAARRRTR
ncbi:MAG: cobalamin biosynthesis protein [Nocardioidaceae bacterium]